MSRSHIKTNASSILENAKLLIGGNVTQIFIAEDTEAMPDDDDYINPYSFIVNTEASSPSKAALTKFENYLQTQLNDPGIKVFSRHFLHQATTQNLDDDLVENYQHLLDTAIEINEIDLGTSWQEQFAAKSKQKVVHLPKGKQESKHPPSQWQSKVSKKRKAPSTDTVSAPNIDEFLLSMFENLEKEDLRKIPTPIMEKISSSNNWKKHKTSPTQELLLSSR